MMLAMKSALSSIARAFDKTDRAPATFFLGLILVAYGASTIVHGLGALIVGVFLIASVIPLMRFLK